MSFLHNFFSRFFETQPAASNAKPPETPLTRAFDKPRNRVVITGVLSVLYLVNVILGGTAFHATPSGVYGALAWQIVLSLAVWIYSMCFFWRNLDGASEKRATIFFWFNVAVACLWLTGFFSLAIEMGKTPDSLNFEPDGKTVTSYKPAIGCLVLNLAFCAIFVVNAIYVLTRKKQLFPKYAEIDDERQAFDASMNAADLGGHGSDHEDGGSGDGHHLQMHDNDRPHSQSPPAGSHAAYDPYGRPAHRPDAYDPHPAGLAASPAPPYHAAPPRYDGANYTQQPAFDQQAAYGGGAAYPGQTPYAATAYQGSAAEPRYPAQGPYQGYGGHQPYPSDGA